LPQAEALSLRKGYRTHQTRGPAALKTKGESNHGGRGGIRSINTNLNHNKTKGTIQERKNKPTTPIRVGKQKNGTKTAIKNEKKNQCKHQKGRGTANSLIKIKKGRRLKVTVEGKRNEQTTIKKKEGNVQKKQKEVKKTPEKRQERGGSERKREEGGRKVQVG